MKWVLIVIIISSWGNVVATAEFNNELSCKVAATGVVVRGPVSTGRIEAYCVAKGVE